MASYLHKLNASNSDHATKELEALSEKNGEE